MEYIKELAKRNNIHQIALNSTRTAIGFYHKQGFVKHSNTSNNLTKMSFKLKTKDAASAGTGGGDDSVAGGAGSARAARGGRYTKRNHKSILKRRRYRK